MTPDLRDDDQLLAVLRAALEEIDRVPDEAVSAAVAAFDLGGVDGELAELITDSLVDEPANGLRHAGDQGRIVAFETPALSLELDFEPGGSSLIGHLDPPGAAVELEIGGQRRAVAVDELGRFRVEIGEGRLRFHLVTPGGRVVTPWVTR